MERHLPKCPPIVIRRQERDLAFLFERKRSDWRSPSEVRADVTCTVLAVLYIVKPGKENGMFGCSHVSWMMIISVEENHSAFNSYSRLARTPLAFH